MAEWKTIVRDKHFLEAPRWRDGRLWFSDFYGERVYSVDEHGKGERVELTVPGQPGGIDWLPDNRLLIVSMIDRTLLRREPSGELVVHADLSGFATGQANDMVVTASGHAYVGNFGFDLMAGGNVEPTCLLCVAPDGTVSIAADDLWFPNGSVLTPGGELLVAETFGNRVTGFSVASDGRLQDRRTWAQFGPEPESLPLADAMARLCVAGDGICLDGDGGLWIADAMGNRLVKAEDGVGIVDEIRCDAPVYACAIGGSDMRTMFICTAPDFHGDARSAATDGRIMACHLDVMSKAVESVE